MAPLDGAARDRRHASLRRRLSPRVFHGWKVVAVAFLVALVGWGLGFYGPGIYLASLRERHGWSTALISSAVTVYYLLGASAIFFIGDVFDRLGPRRTVLGGAAALATGVAALTAVTAPWQLYAAFALMALGWASMSGAAVNTIVAPWFERRRGLAVSLALNGASCGGVVVAPLLLLLISRLGFVTGVIVSVALLLAVLVPAVLAWLHREPRALGQAPDGEAWPARSAPLSPRPEAPGGRVEVARRLAFWTIAGPSALGLAAQVGFLTHQVSYLQPLLGPQGTGMAVGLTTMAAVVGRLAMGAVVDRLDRRALSSFNFAVQAAALGVLAAAPPAPWLLAGCVLYGLGVGNQITLPGLLVQREFPAEHFARTVSLVIAITQLTYSFGPWTLGLVRDLTGGYAAPLTLCAGLQVAAGCTVLVRRPR